MAQDERVDVELSGELAQFVRSQVGKGAFASGADLVRTLVRQAAQREAFHDEVRRKIDAGVASLRAGKGVDGEAFMAALDTDLAEQERQGR